MRKRREVDHSWYEGVRTFPNGTHLEVWGSDNVWTVVYTSVDVIDDALHDGTESEYIETEYYYICVEDGSGIRINVNFDQVAGAYRWDNNAKAGLTEFLERTA